MGCPLPYLLGYHTIVYTDHSACLSAMSSARLSGKLARWTLTIQELIKHHGGKLNANADVVSHNPCTVQDSCAVDDFSVDVFSMSLYVW